MNRQSCTNHPHSFGYICGKYTPPSHCKIITKSVKTAYKCYFKYQVKNQDNRWVPHICYISYSSVLTMWMNRKIKQMPFWVPIVWRKQVDHHSGCCFFCMTKLSRSSRKNKSKIMCLDCQSALKPVSHDLGYCAIPPAKSDIENEETYKSNVSSAESSADDMHVGDINEKSHICLVSWS